MTLIYSFLFVGFICMIGQIILDNTKLTPGEVNVIFVILGVILSFFGVYKIIEELAGPGAIVPITNFGNLLYKGAIAGFNYNGILGIVQNVLVMVSAGISVAILISYLISLFAKPQN